MYQTKNKLIIGKIQYLIDIDMSTTNNFICVLTLFNTIESGLYCKECNSIFKYIPANNPKSDKIYDPSKVEKIDIHISK